jgi:hypothetical protein
LHAVLRIVGNGSEILAGVVAGILQDVADCIYIWARRPVRKMRDSAHKDPLLLDRCDPSCFDDVQ